MIGTESASNSGGIRGDYSFGSDSSSAHPNYNYEMIDADEQDAANVKVEIIDSKGNVVPTADNLVQFAIEGEGKIIGVDNGNPIDHDSYKAPQRKAFNGLCLVVVQSNQKAGNIKLVAKSKGLTQASLEITSLKAKRIPFVP